MNNITLLLHNLVMKYIDHNPYVLQVMCYGCICITYYVYKYIHKYYVLIKYISIYTLVLYNKQHTLIS